MSGVHLRSGGARVTTERGREEVASLDRASRAECAGRHDAH